MELLHDVNRYAKMYTKRVPLSSRNDNDREFVVFSRDPSPWSQTLPSRASQVYVTRDKSRIILRSRDQMTPGLSTSFLLDSQRLPSRYKSNKRHPVQVVSSECGGFNRRDTFQRLKRNHRQDDESSEGARSDSTYLKLHTTGTQYESVTWIYQLLNEMNDDEYIPVSKIKNRRRDTNEEPRMHQSEYRINKDRNKKRNQDEVTFTDKSTHCCSVQSNHREDFVYKTNERNMRLQALLKALIRVREREKAKESWKQYISALRSKYDGCCNSNSDVSQVSAKSSEHCKSLLNQVYGTRSKLRAETSRRSIGGTSPLRSPHLSHDRLADGMYGSQSFCFPTCSQPKWIKEREQPSFSKVLRSNLIIPCSNRLVNKKASSKDNRNRQPIKKQADRKIDTHTHSRKKSFFIQTDKITPVPKIYKPSTVLKSEKKYIQEPLTIQDKGTATEKEVWTQYELNSQFERDLHHLTRLLSNYKNTIDRPSSAKTSGTNLITNDKETMTGSVPKTRTTDVSAKVVENVSHSVDTSGNTTSIVSHKYIYLKDGKIMIGNKYKVGDKTLTAPIKPTLKDMNDLTRHLPWSGDVTPHQSTLVLHKETTCSTLSIGGTNNISDLNLIVPFNTTKPFRIPEALEMSMTVNRLDDSLQVANPFKITTKKDVVQTKDDQTMTYTQLSVSTNRRKDKIHKLNSLVKRSKNNTTANSIVNDKTTRRCASQDSRLLSSGDKRAAATELTTAVKRYVNCKGLDEPFSVDEDKEKKLNDLLERKLSKSASLYRVEHALRAAGHEQRTHKVNIKDSGTGAERISYAVQCPSKEGSKRNSYANIENKLENLVATINNLIGEVKYTCNTVSNNTQQRYLERLNEKISDNCAESSVDKVYTIVENEMKKCSTKEIHSRPGTDENVLINYNEPPTLSETLNTASKFENIIIEELGKSNQAKRDIEDILSGGVNPPCKMQIIFDPPTKERSTEVSASMSTTKVLKEAHSMVPSCGSGSRDSRCLTIAVNTDPLSLFTLFKISADRLRAMLSYFDYNSLLPGMLLPVPRAPQTMLSCASYVCNICEAAFNTPNLLSMHLRKHNKGQVRDCCVCRHGLDRRHRCPGSFKCRYCGQVFMRAYCCELHEQSCARVLGKRHDISESLAILT